MKKILLSAFAFAAMTSAAVAAPVTMTDAQMDAVTAGAQVNNATVIQVNVCVHCKGKIDQFNWAEVNQANFKVDHKKDRHKRKGKVR